LLAAKKTESRHDMGCNRELNARRGHLNLPTAYVMFSSTIWIQAFFNPPGPPSCHFRGLPTSRPFRPLPTAAKLCERRKPGRTCAKLSVFSKGPALPQRKKGESHA
jgi:hypothetical protein